MFNSLVSLVFSLMSLVSYYLILFMGFGLEVKSWFWLAFWLIMQTVTFEVSKAFLSHPEDFGSEL